MHAIVVTSDKHLVLSHRGNAQAFQPGTVSATSEQHFDGTKDAHPFDAYLRAINDPKKVPTVVEELRLGILSESLKLAAVILEPPVNGTGLVIYGECSEESRQISEQILGRDRDEFNLRNPVWTIPIDPPDEIVKQFFRPKVPHPTDEGKLLPFSWHGSSRERIIEVLGKHYGFKEAFRMLAREAVDCI